MTSLLYLLLLIGLLRLFPYVIAYLQSLKTTFLYTEFLLLSPDLVPNYLKVAFQPTIAELETLGFQFCTYFELERTKGDLDTGVLMHHKETQTYAGMEIRRPYTAATSVNIGFSTFFTDGTQLITTSHPIFNIYSKNPNVMVQSMPGAKVVDQWQTHQSQLSQCGQFQTPQKLSMEAYVAQLEAAGRDDIERLANNGEVYIVEASQSYRMTRWTAFQALIKVVKGQRKLQSTQSSDRPLADNLSSPIENTADSEIELEVNEFQRLQRQQQKSVFSRKTKVWILLISLALFAAGYLPMMDWQMVLIFVAVLLLHEAGHLIAMKCFGYQDTAVFFVPFLGALATSRNHRATLTQKFWMLLAGPVPGLILGIGLAIALHSLPQTAWKSSSYPELIVKFSTILIGLNLFNLLPIYPLDGGQIANLLLFSRRPFLAVVFQSLGAVFLLLIGFTQPPFLIFAVLVAIGIPSAFQTAKLSQRLLQQSPTDPASTDQETLLRKIFQLLRQHGYGKKSFMRRYSLAKILLDSYPEGRAKRRTRLGLTSVYLISLLGSLVGILFALIPDLSAWQTLAMHLQGSDKAYQQRLQDRVARANQALKLNPNDVQAYLKRGQAYYSLGNQPAAIADFDRAVQLDPRDLYTYQERARLRAQLKNYSGALADYNQMVQINPKNTLTYFQRAELYRQLKNPQKAIQDYGQILQLAPHQRTAYFERATLRQELQDYRGAIADYTHLLQLTKDDESAYLGRAEARYGLKDYRGAIADVERAIQLDSNYPDAYELRSKIRLKLGDQSGAEADVRLAENLQKEQVE